MTADSPNTVSKYALHVSTISFQGGYTTHFHPNSTLLKGWSFVGSCFYPSLQNTENFSELLHLSLTSLFLELLSLYTNRCVCVCVYTAGHVYIYIYAKQPNYQHIPWRQGPHSFTNRMVSALHLTNTWQLTSTVMFSKGLPIIITININPKWWARRCYFKFHFTNEVTESWRLTWTWNFENPYWLIKSDL